MRIEDISDLLSLITDINKENNGKYYPIDVCVEDDNGEVRYVSFAWYDRERKMLRLTLEDTLFIDNEED